MINYQYSLQRILFKEKYVDLEQNNNRMITQMENNQLGTSCMYPNESIKPNTIYLTNQ